MCGVNLHRRSRGFTLLEVALGVTILAILAGTMFTIVQSSLQAASDIEVVQRENRRMERYVFLLKQLFRTLPPNGKVGLKIIERNPLVHSPHPTPLHSERRSQLKGIPI